MTRYLSMFAIAGFLLWPHYAAATQKQELLELKNTIVNLVDALVAQGVLSEEQAEALQQVAANKARLAAQEAAEEYDETPAGGAQAKKVVRVPYVPDFVKEDIRNQVKQELRREVTEDVVATAKSERWGTADALPDWVNRFEWFGEARLRLQSTTFDDENQPFTYPNFLAINQAGSINGPGTFFNFTEDRERARMRFRVGFNARVNDNIKVGARLTTGNENNPLSMNQTFGQSFGPYNILLDRAFIRWGFDDQYGEEWLALSGGRMPRPFLATDLVWDNDIGFEGVAATLKHRFGGGDDLIGQDSHNQSVYLTLGGFPVDMDELPFDDDSSNDKYLLGGQLGYIYEWDNQSSFEVAAALYDYTNIVGKFNPDGAFGSTRYDWTAPSFSTKGNTMYPIKFNASGDPTLFGLASDFTLANITGKARFSHFAPYYVTLTGDFVKNIGFDDGDVFRRTGVRVPDRTNGWQARLDVGWARVSEFGQWNLYAGYKYLQRDAVLDAFADSNFNFFGTDAQGWLVGGNFGLAENAWVRLRYFSANEIDLAPLGVDILQLDLYTRF